MINNFQDIQELLHFFLGSVIKPGDIVLDATAGRGRDTVFLAECVGPEGKVYAFDIQEEAVQETKKLLSQMRMENRAVLYLKDHALLEEVVSEKLRAVVFNLGYLPGSDRTVKTRPLSTVRGIGSALKLLEYGGLLAITVYRGHEGAEEEAFEVDKFLSRLAKKDFSVLEGNYINQGLKAPYWIIVQKNRED